MMFLDCPAYTDHEGTARCGLPAEVMYRYAVPSTDGPLESAMIECPVGHHFNGPIDSLTWDGKCQPDVDIAAVIYRSPRDEFNGPPR